MWAGLGNVIETCEISWTNGECRGYSVERFSKFHRDFKNMAVTDEKFPVQETGDFTSMAVTEEKFPVQEIGCFIGICEKVIQSCNVVQCEDATGEYSPAPQDVTQELEKLNVPEISKKRKMRKRKKRQRTTTLTPPCKTWKGLSKGHFFIMIMIAVLPISAYAFPGSMASSEEGGDNQSQKTEELTHNGNDEGGRSAFNGAALKQQISFNTEWPKKYRCAVRVTDFPIDIIQDEHRHTFDKPDRCPKKVPVFGSYSACFVNESILIIYCSNDNHRPLQVEHGKGRIDPIFVDMNSEECKSSMEDKFDTRIPPSGDVANSEDTEGRCAVRVTDFPIDIIQDEQRHTFIKPDLCPKIVPVFGSYSACFVNESILIIYCSNDNHRLLQVEHGKGRIDPITVDMNSEVCKSSMEDKFDTRISPSGNVANSEDTEENKSSVEDHNEPSARKSSNISTAAENKSSVEDHNEPSAPKSSNGSTAADGKGFNWYQICSHFLLPIILLAAFIFVRKSYRNLQRQNPA
ncbi:uncharacterized protein LOC142107114 isoform X2 [Mixophyes fleayi]|uniref:uncharacterized protein LOC142107114 isoform X2 n=1 Tax=Mixophyes fleayi TaxID=3061075 RepID=UPI003F4DD717